MPPKTMDASAEPSRPKPAVRTTGGTPAPWARGADWTVGVTSGILLLISLGGWLYHRAQLADIAADHLRLQVTGPARLRAGRANEYWVTTELVTGNPIPAQVDFALCSPDDQRLMVHKEKADENGRLMVAIPAGLDVSGGAKLEVSASYDQKQEEVVTRLSVEPVRYVTYLATDKPLYRPGETISYRSLTLSRFALTADRETLVRFEILDPGGTPVAGSPRESATHQGLGWGTFQIPEDLAGGKYTLVARSAEGVFPDERQTFFIRRYRLPRLKKRLEFARDGYGPGDRVVAGFSVQRPDGAPVAGARLRITAAVDGKPIHEETAETSPHGTFQVEFALPDEIEQGDGQLAVVADDGGTRETIAKTIPIHAGKVEVSFYPEGGHLVAKLENRVYFAARDPRGEPVDLRGRIVDSQGQHVAGVATTYQGLGAFSIVPMPGEKYRLEFGSTAATQQAVRLPEVSTAQKVVLSTGLGVFPSGRPLEFNVRAGEAGLPLVASAWCRGVPVGQQVFITQDTQNGQNANPVGVPLDDDASGVIRLTIYDYSVNPPEPVAERLVYRRPARRLLIEVEGSSRRYSPGDEVDVSLSVSDEDGRPLAAALGVSVADDALFSLADADTSGMPVHLLLSTEIEAPEDLHDPDSYLSESREADVALDLLLAAQGWRRFLERRLQESREEGGDDERLLRLAALDGRARPPAMFDNLIELQERYKASLATYRANRTRASNTLTALSFFGGVGLVMFVAMLNLLNIARGARLWAPAIGVATVCLIVGGILMDPGRWTSPSEGAVAFVPFDVAPATLSPAGQVPENRGSDQHAQELQKPGDDAHETIPGVVRSDSQGRAQVRLDASGPVAGFRVLVDGHAEGGRIGSGKGQVVTWLPFRLEPMLPLEVSPGDRIDVPLAVLNDTDGTLPVELLLEHGEAVQLDGEAQRTLELKAGQCARQHFSLNVVGQNGDCRLTFRGRAGQLADEATRSLKIVQPDLPENLSQDGRINDPACPVRLSTRLAQGSVPWGETVALAAELVNAGDDAQPMTVAVLGLPAGLEVRPDQLEQLSKSGQIDYYQTRAREVICCWRTLAPKEKVALKLDLIASVPGKYTGPASRAYPAGAADRKHWNEPLVVEILRD